MIQAQARAIATGYMDEILLRQYGDCADSSAPRGSWEEIGCYNGLNEAPTDQFGNAITELGDYQVSVSVGSGEPAAITVNISHASGSVAFSLQGQRGNY